VIAEVDRGTARMLAIAAAREPVYVVDGGTEIVATLLCWRNRRARVEFDNGRRRTVDTADVRPIPRAIPVDASVKVGLYGRIVQ
jgi:hypothetical protein